MLDPNSREVGNETLPDGRQSGPASAPQKGKPNGGFADGELRLRSPARREPPRADPPGRPQPPEPDKDLKPQTHDADGKARRSWLRRHSTALVFGLLCLTPAVPAGYLYWDHASHFETTDDTYIAARQFAIAPEVSGYITAVPVTDNEHVAAGGVIARIDDRNYRAALAQAKAQVAGARANIENIDAQMGVQQAQINAAEAQVNSAQAAVVFAQQQAQRYQYLSHTIAGTVQNAQQYASQLHQQQAALDSAQATLKQAQRQVDSLKAQRDSAVASLAQAKAQRDQARLNLSYTTVTAAQPGRVVQLAAAVGQYAQPGTNLTMFVPDDIWITANFKETQLDAMRPGEPVTIDIDAYPERTIHGHLASVQPGSGTAFSLLPAQNATGNWVKIVQRVPVKIVMDDPPTDVALGPGMSVEASVRVNPHPSLYEQLKAWL
ncbi:MAG: HlyD family secretion protein [Alphaproteobacteria bacterium]|nr:HlyD family secretion protein [Alphaproteobacteria bacterium]